MRVLVVGGAGYIGSHTCKALSKAGFEPVVFDNLSRGHRIFVKWGELIEGDILDRAALDDAFSKWNPAAVVHFAAFAYVGESVENPAKYYRNNVAGTLTLLEAMTAAAVDKIVFSSSCATYGTPEMTPISEDTLQLPINPYGRSKLIVEQMLEDFERAHGIRSVCLRYFNACGADPDGEIGEIHDPEPHLIPRAILSSLGQIDDFKVFGDDYPTPDGSAIRDYIHVSDLADAHVSALGWLLRGMKSEKFNLGMGRGFSVKEIINNIKEITGRSVPYVVSQRRPGDPPELVADNTKARKMLGFEPSRSDLKTILTTAWKWHRECGFRYQ